ncbi:MULTISPECIES: LysR family transcriptional regulator [Pseudomonas]|uniref:LysR family transcriptional regulator n=1 Tax=Pseudomonas TaxID=286 RepID=UPI001596755C|nr:MULTISPECIES: LysR family transcriptional regulator [Pseudomonas]
MRHLNDVDLNLLRVFQAIMEERSLTLAAGRLAITQPAVSYALGRLRKLFDDALFVRTPEGMMPTQTAERIALPIGRALTAVRDALNETEPFEPGTSDREFRLCMSDIGEQVFLPALCERLQTLAPQIKLSSELVPVAMVVERMRMGQLDFAIGNLPTLKTTTRYTSLFHEQYACMTRKREGLPAGNISVEQFLALSHVSITSTDSSHVAIEENLAARGLNRHIALRVPHFTVVPQILRHTGWMVTLPEGVARALNHSEDFVIYPLPVEMPGVESTVHWHAAYDADAGNRWFRTFLFETLRR